MIIPKPVETPQMPIGDTSRETIEYAPTSSVYPLAAQEVSSSVAEVLPVPSGEYFRIDKLSVYNGNSSTAETIEVYLVNSGDTAGANNIVAKKSVAAEATEPFDALSGIVLAPGVSLQMSAVGTKSNVFGGFTRFFTGQRRD